MRGRNRARKARRSGTALGPLRKVVTEGVNEYGGQTETLECGHTINRKKDHVGYTNAFRRRCRHCMKENQPPAVAR